MIQKKIVKIISTKVLTVDLTKKYSVLNDAKYFSTDGLKNCLVFISTRRICWIRKIAITVKLNLRDLQECHKKVLKIRILQTLALLKS